MAKNPPAEIDNILLTIVRATNSVTEAPSEDRQGLGLVLTVDGATISGRLIPNWFWFKRVEEKLRKSTPPEDETSNGLADIFSYWGNEMATLRDEEAKVTSVLSELPAVAQQILSESERTEFIHLDDARVYEPGHPGLPSNGMLWRGRLKDISGWSLGLFGA